MSEIEIKAAELLNYLLHNYDDAQWDGETRYLMNDLHQSLHGERIVWEEV